MNKLYKLIFSCVVLLICNGELHAQDIHFSQVFNNPIHLNPANTGMMEAQNRLVGFYRNQWRTVPVKYSNVFFSYDRALIQNSNHKAGVGAYFTHEKAGNGGLTTMKIMLSGAYGINLNEDKQFLSIGVQMGFAQRSVNPADLIFVNQHTDFEYDSNIPSGEDFEERISFADLALGLNFSTKIKTKSELNIGLALNNITNPKNSFSQIESSRGLRASTYINADVYLKNNWFLRPGFYFQNQIKNRAYLLQLLAAHDFVNSKQDIAIEFGGLYRVKDAVIIYAGIDIKSVNIGFNYDINTSAFSAATNNRGGFEVSVGYTFSKKQREEEIIEVEEVE